METYYGQEAQDIFRQLQSQFPGRGDDPPKKNPGYFSAFFKKLGESNPFDNAGRTWEGWLSSESTLGTDAFNAVSSTFWGTASLLDGNTYVNWYKGQKAYWSSSSSERGESDAAGLNSLVETSVTYAPLSYLRVPNLKGGATFEEFKKSRGGTKTLANIETSTGSQRISTEFHHAIISQRVQKKYNLPNWLVNNSVNVWKVNTIQHSLLDSYRFNFMKASIKPNIGFFKKYNWFTKF